MQTEENLNENKHNHSENLPDIDITGRTVYKARMYCSNESEYCVMPDESIKLKDNELVILNTRYGKDIVEISGTITDLASLENEKVREITRAATKEDIEKKISLEQKEEKAFEICKKKIEKHNLQMKLVSAHYLVEEPKIIFFFTADNRIDFRELVKDLVAVFRLRIELRQIGVRDEARVLGGIAVCGRDYCCHGITDKLIPVSIKMAKDQSLSLNSLKISGPCGRLLCCLSYEHQYYQEERGKYPQEGTHFRIENSEFKVSEVNIFGKKVILSCGDGRQMELPISVFSYNPQKKEWKLTKNVLDESYGDDSLLSK